MKFKNREQFFKALNQLVRNGSDIREFSDHPAGSVVWLTGTETYPDCIALFHNEEDYKRSKMTEPEEAKA